MFQNVAYRSTVYITGVIGMQNQYLYCNKVIVYRTSHRNWKKMCTLWREIDFHNFDRLVKCFLDQILFRVLKSIRLSHSYRNTKKFKKNILLELRNHFNNNWSIFFIHIGYSHHSIIRPVRWAELAVLAMYCRFGYRTVRLIEL